MSRALLVSVVEDDLFFRESMKRLMRSLGYSVEVFSSAADFLESPRVLETSCPRNGLLDQRRSDACDGWPRTLPKPHRYRPHDSDNPNYCLSQ
jgi:hypothetical protein